MGLSQRELIQLMWVCGVDKGADVLSLYMDILEQSERLVEHTTLQKYS